MTRIIYHAADLDGHCSGAIARYFYDTICPDNYEMVPMNYGQELPLDEWGEYDILVFIDVSIQPQEKMIQVMQRFKTIIIDHHQSSIGLEKYMIDGSIVMGSSACELSWNFFMKTEIPNFVSLLGRYDVWDNKDKTRWNDIILPFQHGIKLMKTNPCYDENYQLWLYLIGNDKSITDVWIKNTIQNGNIVLQYARNINEMGAAFLCHDVKFEGLRGIAANTFIKNSQFFEGKYDPLKHDVMIAWTYNGKYGEYSVSLYTTSESIDVSKIAISHGGGGHKQASGFSCKHISFKDGNMIVEDK